jgi:hypothetical protein
MPKNNAEVCGTPCFFDIRLVSSRLLSTRRVGKSRKAWMNGLVPRSSRVFRHSHDCWEPSFRQQSIAGFHGFRWQTNPSRSAPV